jgi:uncharacterized membrane protein YfcA
MGAGMLSGLFGVGGGILIVPTLVLWLGFDQKAAQGTSLATIAMPLLWLAYQSYQRNNANVDWQSACVMALAFAIGGYWAIGFVGKIDSAMLSKWFGVLLVIIGIKMALGK